MPLDSAWLLGGHNADRLVNAAPHCLHQDTSGLTSRVVGMHQAQAKGFSGTASPCEVSQREVFILTAVHQRELRLRGMKRLPGPVAKCQSQALNLGLPTPSRASTQRAIKRDRGVWESGPAGGAGTRGTGWAFPGTCAAAKDSAGRTCQLVRPRGGGAHKIWNRLPRFQGTHKHGLPSLGVNILYDFCSPGKY